MAKDKNIPSLNKQGLGMVIGLVIQYALGMLTNLFVKFPESGNEGHRWAFAKSQVLFMAHMLVGYLLLINTIILYIRAVRNNNRTWKIASGIGTLSIIAAAIAGTLFVGNQNDLYSLIMSLSFIVAFLSYAWGFFSSR